MALIFNDVQLGSNMADSYIWKDQGILKFKKKQKEVHYITPILLKNWMAYVKLNSEHFDPNNFSI